MDYTEILKALDARYLAGFQALSAQFDEALATMRTQLAADLTDATKAILERDGMIAALRTELDAAKAEIEARFGAAQKDLRDEVEAALMKLPVPTYQGVFDRTADYQAGHMVTHKGALWHCNAATSGEVPGAGGPWTLAVKSGRDGRDAPSLATTEPAGA